jgi:hypothetical protein
MSRAESWLKRILQFGAGFLLLATLAIPLPVSWMQAANDAMGMAPFADNPLTGYLTRSLAALYAYHGVMVAVISTDMKRYRTMIRMLGYGDILFGLVVLGIGYTVGMPWYWTLGEGPSLVIFGTLMLMLLRQCEREWSADS